MSHNNQMREQAKDYMNNKLIKVGDRDKQAWDMVREVPKINKYLAILFAIVNIVMPGWGTMFAACFASVEETVSKT